MYIEKNQPKKKVLEELIFLQCSPCNNSIMDLWMAHVVWGKTYNSML